MEIKNVPIIEYEELITYIIQQLTRKKFFVLKSVWVIPGGKDE